jgi:hypothetical protein
MCLASEERAKIFSSNQPVSVQLQTSVSEISFIWSSEKILAYVFAVKGHAVA